MVRVRVHCWLVIVLAVADIVNLLDFNKTIHDVGNELVIAGDTRRKEKKKARSTSSDTEAKRSGSESDETLSLTMSSESSSKSKSKGITGKPDRYKPKSSEERKGWRKWHRKCPKCPEDMVKKWRDRSIKWICGGYQRARRSFKSECMMQYRNCQDGTMFVKIHDFRCQNDTGRDLVRGLHFFYDYGKDSQDSSGSDTSSGNKYSDSSINTRREV